MEVFVVEKPELPKVAVSLVSRAGSVADPNAKAGLANMTTRLMRRGTKTRDALQIDETLGNLGTGLGWGAARENASFSMEVLKRNLTPALGVLADITLNPSFPANEFDREKKLALDGLAQAANNPNAIANRVSYMLAFGSDHPYGRPTGGLPGTVQAITREDLVQFHQSYWKPGSSALVFVGDITLAEATQLARQNFSAWTGGAAPAVTIPAAKPIGPGKVYLIDRQGSSQTVVAHVLQAPQRKSEDYYALSLANAVYGGGFGTRLNLNLREDKGYSYGVFAFPQQFSKGGLWLPRAACRRTKPRNRSWNL
jgi:zinc protease